MRLTSEANTCTCKVPRSTKLRDAQRSPEVGLKGTDFRAPEILIFPVLKNVLNFLAAGKGFQV